MFKKGFLKYSHKNEKGQREARGSREAQMVWTICVGLAVVVAALFQTSSSPKMMWPQRVLPTELSSMMGAPQEQISLEVTPTETALVEEHDFIPPLQSQQMQRSVKKVKIHDATPPLQSTPKRQTASKVFRIENFDGASRPKRVNGQDGHESKVFRTEAK